MPGSPAKTREFHANLEREVRVEGLEYGMSQMDVALHVDALRRLETTAERLPREYMRPGHASALTNYMLCGLFLLSVISHCGHAWCEEGKAPTAHGPNGYDQVYERLWVEKGMDKLLAVNHLAISVNAEWKDLRDAMIFNDLSWRPRPHSDDLLQMQPRQDNLHRRVREGSQGGHPQDDGARVLGNRRR